MVLFHSFSPQDTHQIAATFPKKLPQGALLAFFGELGSGKTTFIKTVAEISAGIAKDLVNSPTFQYLNIYKGKCPFYHFDLYRLQGLEDFLNLGFDEILSESGSISCIEWAERIVSFLPKGTICISMRHIKEEERSIAIEVLE